MAGTPVFAAPEVVREEKYTESVDVYSFGMLLVDVAATGTSTSIVQFIKTRWDQHVSAEAPRQPVLRAGMREAMGAITTAGWRPFSAEHGLPGTPPTVNELAARCCSHDPTARPSFQNIVECLEGTCTAEVNSGWEGPLAANTDMEGSRDITTEEAWDLRATFAFFGNEVNRMLNGGGGGGGGGGGQDSRGIAMTSRRASVDSEPPRLGSSTAVARGATSPLPSLGAAAADYEDIAEVVDEHGKIYFYNKKSGVTGWTREEVALRVGSAGAADAREQARNEHIRRHSGQFRSSSVRSRLDVQRTEKGKGTGDGAFRLSSTSLSM